MSVELASYITMMFDESMFLHQDIANSTAELDKLDDQLDALLEEQNLNLPELLRSTALRLV